MRRPVMYLAGLLLATGASLALAGPASAAAAHPVKCHHNHGAQLGDWDDEGDYYSYYNSTDIDSHDVKWSLLSGIGILGIGSNS
ncbi:hypothetical protein [Actinoplanes sp. NPDC026619]|uniref:hypothetical protein n=1 Tax=Actinoplanes sp. NPDC026619 TaxID=3155798 RepID=UPI00340CDD7E